MWHGITAVTTSHDPIVCEGDEPQTLVVHNAGPGAVELRVWTDLERLDSDPDLSLELRAGDHRLIRGALVRVQKKVLKGSSRHNMEVAADADRFAAVAWRALPAVNARALMPDALAMEGDE